MLYLKLFQLNGIVPISDSFKKMDIMETISFLQIILIMSKWKPLDSHHSQVPYLQIDMLAKTPLYPPDNSPCVYVSVCTVSTDRVTWCSFPAEATPGSTLPPCFSVLTWEMPFLYLLVPTFSHFLLSVGNFTILRGPHAQGWGSWIWEG